MATTVLYVDGGCSGNEQRDMTKRHMVRVVTDELGAVVSDIHRTGGSNNIAELAAIRDALVWCDKNGLREVEIRTDSRNNLAWVEGSKVGKQINDRPTVLALRHEIHLLRQSIQLRLVWVPRKDNKAGHHIEAEYLL